MLEDVVQSVDAIVIAVVAIFFLFLGYRPPWWLRTHSDCTKGVRSVPGPYSLPGVGTTWVFCLGVRTLSRLHEYYDDLHARYGPVAKEECLGNVPVVHLFDKRDIVEVLKNGGKYPLRPPAEAIACYRRSRPDRYASTGLVNEQGNQSTVRSRFEQTDLHTKLPFNEKFVKITNQTAQFCCCVSN
jgi:hypothetical protein